MRRLLLFCPGKGKHLKNTRRRACKVKECHCRMGVVQDYRMGIKEKIIEAEDLNCFLALSRYSKSNTISKWWIEHLNLSASNWRYFSLERNLERKMRLIFPGGLSNCVRVTKHCALWKLIRVMSRGLLDHSKFCSHFCLDIL